MMRKLFYLICFTLILVSTPAFAVDVTMTANDGFGASSFNSAGQWSDGLAPSAGKTYSTVGYLLRTPASNGAYTFAGDSLTVGGGDGGGSNPFLTDGSVNNNSLISKTPGAGVVITVNNLILDAGYIRDGMGSLDVWSVAGNIFVTDNGGGLANQCRMNIDAVISGSGTLYLADNGSGEAARATYINSALNTYNGSIQLLGQNAARARLNFSDDSLMNFVIGASGVNNAITVGAGKFGTVNFDGDFKLDLSGAGTNVGDSWVLASVTTQTFGDTFSILGFYDAGLGRWTKTANSVLYQFTESTGTLSVVPEPATLTLLGLGSLALLRRRKS